MKETTKQRTERLLSMSSAELIMHVQDLTIENERYRAALEKLAGMELDGYQMIAEEALEKK
jgi:hypothetical protein